MIKFRQKNFVLPLLGAASTALSAATVPVMVATTALPMAQASKQGKEAKEQAEQSAALMEKQNQLIKQQNKQIEKLARKNPQASAEFGRIKQATYSIGSTLVGVGRACKNTFGSGVASNIKMGLGMSGAGYLANKYISHDMKKNGLDYDQNGNLISTKSYSDQTTEVAKKSLGKRIGGSLFGVGTTLALGGGMDIMGYQADKRMLKDQLAATSSPQLQQVPQTTTYSVTVPRPKNRAKQKLFFALNSAGLFKNIGTSARNTFNNWRTGTRNYFKDWKTNISGGISSFASFGLGGTKNVQKFGENLRAEGGTLGKVGDWIKEHPARANLVTAVPLVGAASLTWNGATKVGDTVGRKLDPSAYKYKDAKENAAKQQLQQ